MSDVTDDMAIEVTGVTRNYPGQVAALAGVDLSVAYGEMVAITGPSGCGKSTLLHLLAAIDSPTAGSVVVAGHDLARSPRPERIPSPGGRTGLPVPQPPSPASALLNVELPMLGTHRSAHRAQVPSVVSSWPRSTWRLRTPPPTELSGGERQRVAIARALSNDPKILLADEPTGSLDSKSTARFLELLERLSHGGTTIVMVTHDSEVAAHAHRIIEMRDGKVIAEKAAPVATPAITSAT